MTALMLSEIYDGTSTRNARVDCPSNLATSVSPYHVPSPQSTFLSWRLRYQGTLGLSWLPTKLVCFIKGRDISLPHERELDMLMPTSSTFFSSADFRICLRISRSRFKDIKCAVVKYQISWLSFVDCISKCNILL
jgi:hypothetical protein